MRRKRWQWTLWVAIALITIACNDNKKDEPEPPAPEYPKVLELKGQRVAEFKVYVGSPDGAVLLDDHDLTPEYFWKSRLESYPSESLRFDDEDTMSHPDKGWQPLEYKFVKDSLFRYIPNWKDWMWSAKGTPQKLEYHIGYYYARTFKEYWQTARIEQDNSWVKPEEEFYDFPASVTDLRDTVAVCNIIYTYESATE